MKEKIIHYLKFGPMDFDFKDAMLLFFIIDFPVICLIYFIVCLIFC